MRWLWIAMLVGCFKVTVPLGTTTHDGSASDTLVILLPGFGASGETFVRKEIISTARATGLHADLIAVDAHYGYYVGDQFVPRLSADVMADVADRYEHIWVLGISMGGLGALLTAQAFADDIEGVVLLSPYLGRRPTLRALQEVGMDAWRAPADPMWDEELWAWLQALDERPDTLPPIYMGYGTRDLGMRNLDWLAGHLPPERVRQAEGGHTWKVWRELTEGFFTGPLEEHEAFR